jgi:hypothetical protein
VRCAPTRGFCELWNAQGITTPHRSSFVLSQTMVVDFDSLGEKNHLSNQMCEFKSDELAVILGHEISHRALGHCRESMSFDAKVSGALLVVLALFDATVIHSFKFHLLMDHLIQYWGKKTLISTGTVHSGTVARRSDSRVFESGIFAKQRIAGR